MASDTTVNNHGIGFFGLLTIVFVIAKLTGYLDWSWWWVFSPIFIGIGLALTIIAVIAGIALIAAVLDR